MGHDVTDGARELAVRVRAQAEPVAHDVAEGARDLAVRAIASAEPVAERVVERATEVLDTSLVRGGAAWLALQGGPVGPPLGRRRWPWAVAAAVLGAAAGAAAALVVGRLQHSDAPGAQAPEDVEAVVDRPAEREQVVRITPVRPAGDLARPEGA